MRGVGGTRLLSVASYAAAAATAAAVAVAVDAGVRRTDESAACGGGGAAGAGPVPSTLAPCESMPCLVFQKKRFFFDRLRRKRRTGRTGAHLLVADGVEVALQLSEKLATLADGLRQLLRLRRARTADGDVLVHRFAVKKQNK